PLRKAVAAGIASRMPEEMWGRGLMERLGADVAARYLDGVGIFSARESMALCSDRGASSLNARTLEPYFSDPRRDLLTSMQHADQMNYLPEDILVKADRMSMQSSREVRPPFLDHRVVEFGNRCPPRLKVHGEIGKYILRRSVRDYLPAETIRRRKMGF